ncbi:S8 family serine peptidase [candidate division KSB1 bacterium]|nr:S8 family serine peptidase [candidate division KSB1 bacterium]
MRRIFVPIFMLSLATALTAIAKPLDLIRPGEPYYDCRPAQVLVKFHKELTGSAISDLAAQIGGKPEYHSALLDFYRITLPAAASVSDAVKFFRSQPTVEWANFNYIAQAFYTPNDPFYSYQWHYTRIGMEQAWDITRGSADIIVADADQGWQFDHADFAGVQTVSPYDFVDNDNDPSAPNLVDSHGMHTAGTILAATNNSIGVAGVAPLCRLQPLRVLGDNGSGEMGWIADGIAWAGTHGAHVLNLSLGFPIQNNEPPVDPGPPLSTAVSQATNAGVVICASSGNDGADYVSYPAAYEQCIAVGSTGFDDAIAPYSNRGTALDVTAPGGNTEQDLNQDGYVDGVLSTLRNEQGDYYGFWQGTSMAAPHVSGLAALLRAHGLAANQVRQALQTTAVDLGAAGRDNVFGHGRINALAALQYQGGGGNEITLLNEPFENFPLTDWIAQQDEAQGVGWQVLSGGAPDCNYGPHGGSDAVWHDDEQVGGHQDDWLITPLLAIPAGATDVSFTFWERNCYVTAQYYEYHGVLWSADGTNWTEIVELSTAASDWHQIEIDATALAGQSIRFGWHYTGTYATEWFLDDVLVTAQTSGAAGDRSAAAPSRFTLADPYPNPFNNSTQIPFELSTASRVELSIYNLLGQEVARLTDGGVLSAGAHAITWDAAGVTSGIYLLQMKAGGTVETRKVVLLK